MVTPTGLPVMVVTYVPVAARSHVESFQPPSMLTPLLVLVMLRLPSA
jgi:hypothetical protein